MNQYTKNHNDRILEQMRGIPANTGPANDPSDGGPANIRSSPVSETVIDQHIGWLKMYVGMTDESNWRDMRLLSERQLERLSEAVDQQRGFAQLQQSSPETATRDIVERLREATSPFWAHTRVDVIAEAATEIENLRRDKKIVESQAVDFAHELARDLAQPSPASPETEAAGYAERLAAALWEKHYKNDAPHWKPLSGDLIGIISQIDNMTTGLTRGLAQRPAMQWERAEQDKIDVSADYVVKDNGGEWRDHDLHVMSGFMVKRKLDPNYVRGRPVWVAKIVAPSDTSTVRCPPIPELKYVREPCHMCGAVTEGEAETKCKPKSDQTGERYCGCDTFDAEGYALGPTLESMAAQESWYKAHHSCNETCSVSSIERGAK
jgi:hypothetical protein